MSKGDIGKFREEYGIGSMVESQMDTDPLKQFKIWFEQAIHAQVPEPNAMTLATADTKGQPSMRIVLLKEISEQGLTFYTNYQSRKAHDIAENPWAALNFFWYSMERQVRMEGSVQKVSREQSEAYFQTRPRGSQLGAWVSPQSQVIPDRDHMEKKLQQYQERYRDQDIPCPPHWGGFLLKPHLIEFWQGGAHRLHDRLQYRIENNGWSLCRLAP